MTGKIYFVQGRPGTPIKIGYTTAQVSKRIAELQVAHPYALRALLVISGTMAQEAMLHRELQADRLLGEWFEATPRLLSLMRNLERSPNCEAAIDGFRQAMTQQADAELLISEAQIAAIFSFPVHQLAALRAAGYGPPHVERRLGKRLLRYYRIGDFREWLTKNGRVRQSINWSAAATYPGHERGTNDFCEGANV